MPPPRAGWLAEGAEDRAATGPQTPAALAGARRPPVGHVLNLQATGSSPPQASAPGVAAVAAVEEEITREDDMSASGRVGQPCLCAAGSHKAGSVCINMPWNCNFEYLVLELLWGLSFD